MNSLFWTVILLAVGLLVMVLEVFVPSGGVLGLLSVVALGAGVVTAEVVTAEVVVLGDLLLLPPSLEQPEPAASAVSASTQCVNLIA